MLGNGKNMSRVGQVFVVFEEFGVVLSGKSGEYLGGVWRGVVEDGVGVYSYFEGIGDLLEVFEQGARYQICVLGREIVRRMDWSRGGVIGRLL